MYLPQTRNMDQTPGIIIITGNNNESLSYINGSE